jgi:Nucleotidyl transferase AbiEii toxin, Type IV TA system
MRYATAGALRAALDQRLLDEARRTGRDIARLRRRVVVERLLVRFAAAEEGSWVLKGGVAVEVRIPDRARRTKDIDLARRELEDHAGAEQEVHRLLVEAILPDPQGDLFEFRLAGFRQMRIEGIPGDVFRANVDCRLDGRTFDRVTIDVATRTSEVQHVERIRLPGTLAFAEVPTVEIVAVDLNQHFAEKLHAMTRLYGDRQSSRVKDLVDLVLFIETGLVPSDGIVRAVDEVFTARGTSGPKEIPDPPVGWDARYAELAEELELSAGTIQEAMEVLRSFWSTATRQEEGTDSGAT